jgi:hypothetical protein
MKSVKQPRNGILAAVGALAVLASVRGQEAAFAIVIKEPVSSSGYVPRSAGGLSLGDWVND